MSINLKTLISKLGEACRVAAERAANLCIARGNYEIDLEHFFMALLEQPRSDFVLIMQRSGIQVEALEQDLAQEVGRLKTGNSRTPVFSRHLPRLFEKAWLIASLDTLNPQIRSGHIVMALLADADLVQLACRGSSLFAKIRREPLKHEFFNLTAGSVEATPTERAIGGEQQVDHHADAEDEIDPASATGSLSSALRQFTSNLTMLAGQGKIDPVIGRDAEIRQLIDVLLRRRQNNPILTGEAGVGKTAVVEGLARRIAEGDVPTVLQEVQLHSLDMGLLQAGASVKGEFERRLKGVIDEVKRSPHPIILFIDEAHTMIGAGGAAGQNDAANLLKPALARGELRTIAATTWSEYKRYFEKDAALARRFQVVKVEEPGESLAVAMLRGMVPLMEQHFGIRVLDEAVTEAVRLSHRYISGRQLPDKAVGLLDTACAKVALCHGATPGVVEDAHRQRDRLSVEIEALQREAGMESDRHDARLRDLHTQRELLEESITALEQRHGQEQVLVRQLVAQQHTLLTDGIQDTNQRALLAQLQGELKALQGDAPMIPLVVDGAVIAEIVASWTGVPLGKMVKDEVRTVTTLAELLAVRVVGQPKALEAIAQRVRTAAARLEDPDRPRGVFMLVGPSGVGKTETALALADCLYGGERKLITLNMSEYQEAHSVSGLKGSPPGYVGYGEGGVLTEAVRRNPYSVVLLDEVEKAHPDVLELFFQVLDKGQMDDAEGRTIDFRNTLILLTSNVGSAQIMAACLNKPAEELPSADALAETLHPLLVRTFKPAFLGRVKVVPYFPLADSVLLKIIELKLERIRARVAKNHNACFSWSAGVVKAVLQRCTEVDSGARNVDHILNGTLLPEVAGSVLAAMSEEREIAGVSVSTGKKGKFVYRVS